MKQGLILKSVLSAAIIASLAGCATAPAQQWEADKTYKLTILHTNDHHGRFWQNQYGEYGMAARKTLIDQLRADIEAQGGSVLLLSGGDINTGVPESDLQDAEPDFKGMSKIGYDAMALGNHEFDNPLEVLFKQKSGRTSQCCRPTFTIKRPRSVCLNRTISLISKGLRLRLLA